MKIIKIAIILIIIFLFGFFANIYFMKPYVLNTSIIPTPVPTPTH